MKNIPDTKLRVHVHPLTRNSSEQLVASLQATINELEAGRDSWERSANHYNTLNQAAQLKVKELELAYQQSEQYTESIRKPESPMGAHRMNYLADRLREYRIQKTDIEHKMNIFDNAAYRLDELEAKVEAAYKEGYLEGQIYPDSEFHISDWEQSKVYREDGSA